MTASSDILRINELAKRGYKLGQKMFLIDLNT